MQPGRDPGTTCLVDGGTIHGLLKSRSGVEGFGTPEQVFELNGHAERGIVAGLSQLLQVARRFGQTALVEAGELHELIDGATHQGTVFCGDKIEEALRRVLEVLLRELDRINQLSLVEIQGCFAVGDDQVRAKTTLRRLTDVLYKIPAGEQGQLGMNLWVQFTDLSEHKI